MEWPEWNQSKAPFEVDELNLVIAIDIWPFEIDFNVLSQQFLDVFCSIFRSWLHQYYASFQQTTNKTTVTSFQIIVRTSVI